MPRKPRRPKPFAVGPVRVRAIRGPHKDDARRWYWRAELYEGGLSRSVWTGWANRGDALHAVADLVARDALDEPRTEDREADIETVLDLLETYVAAQLERQDLASRTKDIYALSGRRLVAEIGSVRLDRLDRRTLETLRDGLLRKGLASRTVELDLNILRRAWGWGRPIGLTPDRDLHRPQVKVRPTREKRTPTPDEFHRVLDQLSGWPRLLVLILGTTGCRAGEGIALRWGDIDLDRAELRVSGKTGPRVVPIAPALAAELEALERGADGARLLPVGTHTAQQSISQRYLKQACAKAGVPYFTPHGLRRMVIDQLYTAGTDVGTVAQMLGQSAVVALRHYRQATSLDKRSAVERARLGERPAGLVVSFKRREEG